MARDHSVSAADNFGGLARAIVRARRMIFSCCPVLGCLLSVYALFIWQSTSYLRVSVLFTATLQAWHGELPDAHA